MITIHRVDDTDLQCDVCQQLQTLLVWIFDKKQTNKQTKTWSDVIYIVYTQRFVGFCGSYYLTKLMNKIIFN